MVSVGVNSSTIPSVLNVSLITFLLWGTWMLIPYRNYCIYHTSRAEDISSHLLLVKLEHAIRQTTRVIFDNNVEGLIFEYLGQVTISRCKQIRFSRSWKIRRITCLEFFLLQITNDSFIRDPTSFKDRSLKNEF